MPHPPTHRRIPAACAGLVLLTVLCLAEGPAAQVRLECTDGRVFQGQLSREDSQGIELLISGIPLFIPAEQIRRIEYLPDITQQYAQHRALLADDDISGRYSLAAWLYENRQFALAHQELLDLRQRAPDHDGIKVLLKLVEDCLARQPTAERPAPPNIPSDHPGSESGPPSTALALPTQKLSPREVNLLRVYELDLSTRPRLALSRQALDRLFQEYANHPKVAPLLASRTARQAFLRQPANEQVRLIFEVQARPLYEMIQVFDDPPAFRTFRTVIHETYVVGYCGSAACHGGPKAGGRLFLFRDRSNNTETVYTNFFILDRYRKDLQHMIDRERPELSLLIQFGLPRQLAQTPHPDVPGWRPALHPRHPLYQRLIRWIGQELMPWKLLPKAGYPIDYQPPVPTPSSAPTPSSEPPQAATPSSTAPQPSTEKTDSPSP